MNYDDATSRWVEKRFGYDAGSVSSVEFESATKYGGYCETCEYTYSVVEVNFLVNGKRKYEEISQYESFSDILRELLEQ